MPPPNSYDSRNELLNETSVRNGGYSNAFGYDGAENPTTFNGSPNSFNADNRNAAFAFDGNGNPSTYKGVALSFDPENRLTSYGTTMTAGYDGDGLRAWKNTAAGKTYLVYDGDSPELELDSNGNVTAFNVWGMNGLLSRRTEVTSVYTFDPQGSVVQRLDANQNILSTSAYDAWGNPLVPNPNDPFGYEAQWGYYTDNETGLLLLTHRYYDPTQGRFLTRDPIGYSGGVNLYGYVGNEVLNYEDNKGKQIGEAILEGGTADLIGGGPEDPAADIVAAGIIIWDLLYHYTIVNTYPQQSLFNIYYSKPCKRSVKERSTDVPRWSKEYQRDPNESCQKFAKRILDDKYGINNWKKGLGSEFNKIIKNCERK